MGKLLALPGWNVTRRFAWVDFSPRDVTIVLWPSNEDESEKDPRQRRRAFQEGVAGIAQAGAEPR